jgi:predicted TIM-barrel fold metal-dependent hydrolase
VIDSHLHQWDPAALDYPWLAGEPALQRSFLLSDLDTGCYQVDGFIVVEAGCQDGPTELDWLTRLAESWPLITGVVVQVPVELGPPAAALLAQAARHPLTVGVRRNVQDERDGFMLAPPMVEGVRQLAGHRLPFDACVREHQIKELTALVDRCPEVTFVLDHLGKPAISHRRVQPWFDEVAALAKRSNVVAKLSGLTTEADHEHWQPVEILPYLRHAIEIFGPQRCMFGSDWPVATLATAYDRWVDLVVEATTDLTGAECSAIFSDTAQRIYGRTDQERST